MAVGLEQLNNRRRIIENTAATVTGRQSSDTGYAQTIASILDKIEKGEAHAGSSTAELLSKMQGGAKESISMSDTVGRYSDFTSKVSLKNSADSFCESIRSLLEQKVGTDDYDELSDAVEQYVLQYNEMKKQTEDTSYAVISNYFKQIRSVTGRFTDKMAGIGITLDTEGNMQYNAGTLYSTPVKELSQTFNVTVKSYLSEVKKTAEGLNTYMDRLTGQKKKYYGLKAKKRNTILRQQYE